MRIDGSLPGTEVRQRGPDEAQDRLERPVDRDLPGRLVEDVERAARRPAGVHDEQVEAAEARDRLIDR